jgi:magnesium-transporting ATPase (P-type)
MAIPVDGILVRGSGVTVDESAMTGESDELKKEPLSVCNHRLSEHLAEEEADGKMDRNSHSVPSPIMLSGTQIQTGEGWFLVIVVGKNSCQGKIMESLEQEIEDTPLQEKLEAIATDIGYLGMFSASITVLVLFIRFFIEQGMIGFDWADNIGTYLHWWFNYIIVGITIIVVAVPEGLPLAVIISLAYSVRKMLQEQNFVKRLSACEIMGGANNICSDKTGTLTKNEMTVVKFWQGDVIELDVQQSKLNLGDYILDEKQG